MFLSPESPLFMVSLLFLLCLVSQVCLLRLVESCVADSLFLHALIGVAAIGHRELDKFLCE